MCNPTALHDWGGGGRGAQITGMLKTAGPMPTSWIPHRAACCLPTASKEVIGTAESWARTGVGHPGGMNSTACPITAFEWTCLDQEKGKSVSPCDSSTWELASQHSAFPIFWNSCYFPRHITYLHSRLLPVHTVSSGSLWQMPAGCREGTDLCCLLLQGLEPLRGDPKEKALHICGSHLPKTARWCH